MSLARKHFQRVMAEKAANDATSSAAETMEGLTAYEQMLSQLQVHTAQLKSLQSREAKIALKKEFAPLYDGYVDGILAGDSSAQDDVLITQMIWRIDTGDYDRAYEIALHALTHKLVLPERFSRDLATYLAEDFAEAALQAGTDADIHAPSARLLVAVALDLGEQDMPDEVRAKLHKAIAFRLQAEASPDTNAQALENALEHVDRALKLDARCGLKKHKEQLIRELKKQEEPPTTD